MRMVLASALLIVAACAPPKVELPMPQSTIQPSPKLLTWGDLVNRPRPKATHAIQWGKGATDIADLWLPDGPGPHPVVLMVHGGCWQKQVADRTLMDWAAEDLRGKGLAVWNIEYRGVDEPGGGYPGTFLDVARAADALRDSAATYNLKIDQVVVFGHSAGGHLGLWLAARPKLAKSSPLRMDNPLPIAGVLSSGGLADLKASAPVTAADCLASIMDKLVGAPSASRPDVFSDTSPAEMLPLGVPQVSVNGSLDRTAPPILGQGYSDRARKAGDVSDAVLVPGAGHVELVSPGTQAFETQANLLQKMLR
jgi:acetyl esterase/lipase